MIVAPKTTGLVQEIETPRLLLRGWQDHDLESWVALNADPRVMEYFTGVYTRDESIAIVTKRLAEADLHGHAWWIVEIKESGTFAGKVSLHPVPFDAKFTPAVEVGGRFAVDSWGHGYATEAASAALVYAFEAFGCDEVVGMTARLNLRSQRLMRRLGMTHHPSDDFDHPRIEEGHPLRPHVLYRLQKS